MSIYIPPALVDRGIQAWGDSLTESTSGVTNPWGTRWPTVLSSLFRPFRAVNNQGVGGETAAQVATRMLAYQSPVTQIQVIWVGRNGVLTLSAASIIATIQTMVDVVTDGRYVVLTVPPKTDGTEDPADANGILVQALNDLIMSTWPDNCIDIATLLGRDDSLRVDGVHPTVAGYALIANAIYTRILAEGW